ncbi:hypothetical protein COCSADRAFT_169845 [Bipolaris sorokiniana ND90Pr]|uniref:DUF7730 domain-containing protein n=1 Tax=Cochliobolus sativus (strain ND90Pr / ATCC 201652) TaxID=665912 RepID=M2T8R8_COCSN|nr:uncharacterized protein COCSADRAFT_169845 [Bipolaris sorokiniana ND90Pr]EMD65357.1 hypothetical protein COCSADRAFT_169845 [Bipolaris sorokiniana ND90Pr]
MATIAPPENLQPQSALVQLPSEIKHIIFSLCLISDTPISDPHIACYSKERQKGPMDNSLSRVSLLQTCRRIYHEIDRRPLFAQNTFRFSSLDTMRTFLQTLPTSYSKRIQDIEIDLRKLNSDHPHLTREWLQYLAWTQDDRKPSLRMDAGGLKCLRLNLEAWPVIPMYRCELWNVLRNILRGFADIERIVVTGTSRGKTMAQKAPWSPVHFVGGDNVGSDDLISRMSNCVVARLGEHKVIKWLRKDNKLQLEVSSIAPAGENTGARLTGSDTWPLNGVCTVSTYDQYRLDSNGSELNPSVDG